MNDTVDRSFVRLETFWRDFMHTQVILKPIAPRRGDVESFLDAVFGRLTTHAIIGSSLPVTCVCSGCRNNTNNRESSVCETHLGVTRGVLEAVLGVPLEIRADQEPYHDCHIHIETASAISGFHSIPCARRVGSVELFAGSVGSGSVLDRRHGLWNLVPPDIFTVLYVCQEFRTAEDVVMETGLTLERVVQVLDHCYQAGWVECEFALVPNRVGIT
jgi:hypothetical protein